MKSLREAAQSVVERWDAPVWKDVAPTAVFIGELRAAIANEEEQSVERVPEVSFGNIKAERDALVKGLQLAADRIEHGDAGIDSIACVLRAAAMLAADEELSSSLAFYKKRVELLQTWQSKMRDPERTIACDIIANGKTFPPENAGDRYKIPIEAQQVAAPQVPMTRDQVDDLAEDGCFLGSVYEITKAVEQSHDIGVKP
jgi:hypothetical protein